MSLRFIDGFNNYTVLNSKYDYSQNISVSTGGRFDLHSLGVNYSQNTPSYVYKIMDNKQKWIVGFSFYVNTTNGSQGSVVELYDGSTAQLSLRLNSDYSLSLYRGSTLLTNSTKVIIPLNWYYLELKATIASSIPANSCIVRVTGVEYINLPAGTSTQNSSNALANKIFLGNSISFSPPYSSSNNVYLIDDLYVCDGSGTTNNDFLGDVRVQTLYPSGNGFYSQFARQSGLIGNNYASVNEISTDGDYTYVESSGVGNSDSYQYGDLPTIASNVVGIQFGAYARKTDAGFRQLGQFVRVGSTDYVLTSGNLLDSYQHMLGISETNPSTGSTWTNSDINNLEAGIKLLS